MQDRPIVALDVDGVILDFDLGWRRVAEDCLGRPLTCNPRIYTLKDRYALSTRELYRVWLAFDRQQAWTRLPPVAGAVAAVRRLLADHDVHLVTAIPRGLRRDREINLQAIGLPGLPVHCVGVNVLGRAGCKVRTLATLRPQVYVDDRLAHLHEALAAGVPHLGLVDTGIDQGVDRPDHPIVCHDRLDTVLEALLPRISPQPARVALRPRAAGAGSRG